MLMLRFEQDVEHLQSESNYITAEVYADTYTFISLIYIFNELLHFKGQMWPNLECYAISDTVGL